MEIFCKTTLPIPQSVKTALSKGTLDGVSIMSFAEAMFGMGGGFNSTYMTTVRKAVLEIHKPFLFGTTWGCFCGNYIYNNFLTIEFVRKHHIGQGQPVPMKIPVFYEQQVGKDGTIYPFLEKVREVTIAIAGELKKEQWLYDLLYGVYITGDNESTWERRTSSTDFTDTDEKFEAYYDAAQKWITQQYSIPAVIHVNKELTKLFNENYPDKNIIEAYITSLNGDPCVGFNGEFVKPNKRYNITSDLLNYGRNLTVNFQPMTTVFNSTTQTTDRFAEVQRELYNKPENTDAQFEAMVEHAKSTRVELLQVHLENINKYKYFK